jgi:hypothetical protein
MTDNINSSNEKLILIHIPDESGDSRLNLNVEDTINEIVTRASTKGRWVYINGVHFTPDTDVDGRPNFELASTRDRIREALLDESVDQPMVVLTHPIAGGSL